MKLRAFIMRVAAMANKEIMHIRRDPRTLLLALGMPVILLVIFGYGVSFDIERIPLVTVDHDQSAVSRSLTQAFTSANEFTNIGNKDIKQAEALLHRGEALAILVIPVDFSKVLLANKTSPIQLIIDGADPVVTNQIISKSDAIVRAQTQRLIGVSDISLPLQVQVWTKYNPLNRSALFLVPGLAAYLLAISAVMLTALTIAGEWERGSMEQLFASPVGRLEIVIGKLLPYLVLGMVEVLLVITTGALAFDVPVRGSLVLLFTFAFLFLIGMLGQGLLISVIAKNQLVATQAGALSSLLPSMILSGVVFPLENMPKILQGLSYIVSARYMVAALRGIMLKGNGLETLWSELMAQIIFATVVITLATLRFRRRLA
ncbi:MAG: ABC transporter permease [Deltaproteobacteria bacterium]|nr:ABC transporter permease [Deltaproteobacteria bacterium]